MAHTMKYDKDGKGYYTPRQVMEMAHERGLPARLISGYSVMPLSTVEALGVVRDWRRYYPHEYPKRVYCGDRDRGCGASLTPTDLELGHCTQCSLPLEPDPLPLVGQLLMSLREIRSERSARDE